MKKEDITNKQGISMIVLFICGSSLVLTTAGGAKADLWLAILLALAGSVVTVMIYGRILILYPENDFYEILQRVFGKIIGNIFIILYSWFAFHLAVLVLRNFSEFIMSVGLEATPEIVIKIVTILLSLYVLKNGIMILGRWSELFVFVILILVYFTLPLYIPIIEVNNLKPFLYHGMKPVLMSAFSTLTFPFAETVLFLPILDSLKDRKSAIKVYLYGLLIGGIIIFSTAIFEIMVLGEHTYFIKYFSAYSAASKINIRDFITRIEIVVSATFLIGGFVKISACLFSCCKGIITVFKLNNYRLILTPVAIMCIIIAETMYENMIQMFEWAINVWPWYASVFQIIFPVIILITCELKIKSRYNKGIK